MKEFITRTITAFFLIIFAYGIIQYVPPLYFSIILFVIATMAVRELVKLTEPKMFSFLLAIVSGLIIAASFTFDRIPLSGAMFAGVFLTGMYFLWTIRQKEKLESFVRDMGIQFLVMFYLYVPLYFMLELKELGPNYLFFMIIVIAIGDSGAYFVGSAIGKHKIYPVASPNKSLEGLIAAIITAALSGWLAIVLFPLPVKPVTAVITGGVIGLLSQLSDPVESLFKRSSGKKDSGELLPGHGGVLDRVDSYIFCAPALYFIIMYLWK